MFQSNNSSVSFINNDKYNDSLNYDTSTSSGNCDTHTLLTEAEDNSGIFHEIKIFIPDIRNNYPKLFILVCDIFCIFIFTFFSLRLNVLGCGNSTSEDILEWCKPYEPVDKVIVDLNFDLLVHCDVPKSCVAYAEILMEKQGFNYNFIIGDEDLVYVGNGFQCKSDALRLQMLITRYAWDNKQPVYKIPHEVVLRYTEIIQEGLRCGKISPNFTVMATCSVYGEWCGADNIKDGIPWTYPQLWPRVLILAHYNRKFWYEQPHVDNHPFYAFHIDRVYDSSYTLKACNNTQN